MTGNHASYLEDEAFHLSEEVLSFTHSVPTCTCNVCVKFIFSKQIDLCTTLKITYLKIKKCFLLATHF